MRLAVALLLLSGCEVLFPLDDNQAPPDDCPDSPAPKCGVGDPDEDEDGVPDDCDLCPGTSSMQTDADDDGIGDDCDPHVDAAPVCPARRFVGFSVDDGRWVDTTGIRFEGGGATLFPPTNTVRILRSKELHGSGRAEAFIADRIFDSSVAIAGVVVAANDRSGFFCALHPKGANGTLLTGVLADNQESIKAESANTFSQTPGVFHQLRLTVTAAGDVTCISEHAGNDHVVTEVDAMLRFTVDEPITPGGYGLILGGSVDEVEYVDFIPD